MAILREANKVKPLHGLAEAWEGDSRVRRFALKKGGFLQWPNDQKVGVISFESIKPNATVISHILKLHCPEAEDRKTVPIDGLKPQVG